VMLLPITYSLCIYRFLCLCLLYARTWKNQQILTSHQNCIASFLLIFLLPYLTISLSPLRSLTFPDISLYSNSFQFIPIHYNSMHWFIIIFPITSLYIIAILSWHYILVVSSMASRKKGREFDPLVVPFAGLGA
jgi:hypothetical protein